MIAVTGATGHLGPLAIQELLRRGVAAGDIVAVVRSTARVAGLAQHGVQVRRGDYDEPETLAGALAGVDKLLFVSGSEAGRRIAQHRNVIDAARGAGVRLIAYTSIVRADSTPLLLAREHKATEEMIRGSGIPYLFLRNSWYVENYTRQLPQTLERGVILGCAGHGRLSAATRADYAAAAAAALTSGAEDRVYELGADDAFTLTELAAEISRQSGRSVEYQDMPFETYVATLVGVGLPEPAARLYADADLGIARGDLLVESGDLSRLIGRPTTPLSRAIADALATLERDHGSSAAEASRRTASSGERSAAPS